MPKQRISIKRCADYSADSLLSSIRFALEPIGGIKGFVTPGQRVLLKPNMLMGKPAEAAVTTNPAIVEAVIILVKEAKGIPFVGDSPGIGSAEAIAKKCGIADAAKKHSVEIVDLKTAVPVDGHSSGRFRHFEVSREAMEADVIINLPKLKTHAQMFLTMGVKNIFGCVPGTRKAQWHLTAGVDVSAFASMILDLYRTISPDLTIMDAVVSMEGNGPSGGEPRKTGFIAAAEDAVSLDAAITTLMGRKYDEVPILKEAARRGLLPANHEDFEMLGELPTKEAFAGFKYPPLMHTSFTASLPPFIDKRLRRALSSMPRVNQNACTMCSHCVRVCPPSVMSDKGRITIDYDKCIRCYCCQEICPQGAIDVSKGWLARLLRLG